MPQMSPINWLILFIIFSMTMMIFNIKNYYCFFYFPKPSQSNFIYKIKSLSWQW